MYVKSARAARFTDIFVHRPVLAIVISVVVMMLSTAASLFYFIKSLIAVRRARAMAAQEGN